LVKLSQKAGRPISDPWSMRLAALHLRQMIETGRDMEKTLVECRLEELEKHEAALEAARAAGG
jgi:hypothetical protein